MSDMNETVRSLKEKGYPNNLLKCWDLKATENQQSAVERLLDVMLAGIPPLERTILEMRYKKYYTLKQIATELELPYHLVRARKSNIIRKMRFSKTGLELYRCLRM